MFNEGSSRRHGRMEESLHKGAGFLRTTQCENRRMGKHPRSAERRNTSRKSRDGKETHWRWNTSQKGTSCSLRKFPASTTWRRNLCKYSIIPDVANVDFIGVIATMGSCVMGCLNSIPYTHNCQRIMLFIVVHQTHSSV